MRGGSLRHRVSVLSRADVDDGHGGTTQSLMTVCDRVSALIEPLRGVALDRARQIDPRTTHSVLMRWRRDVQARMTLVYHDGGLDRMFEIIGSPTTDSEKRVLMTLMCKEAD